MMPHLAGNQQRHHAHFTASCPLNCPARRSHQSHASLVQESFPRLGNELGAFSFYVMGQCGYVRSQGSNSLHSPLSAFIDASKLHPAFSGLFYQQRRTLFTQAHNPSIPPPLSLHDQINMNPSNTRSCHCHDAAHHPTIQCMSVQRPGVPPPPPPSMMDPARTSPIFYGYAPNHDKAKM